MAEAQEIYRPAQRQYLTGPAALVRRGGAPIPDVEKPLITAPALPTPNFRSHSPRIPRPVYEEFPGPGAYRECRSDAVSRCRRAPELGAWTRAPPRIQTPVPRPDVQKPHLEVGARQAAPRRPAPRGATRPGGRAASHRASCPLHPGVPGRRAELQVAFGRRLTRPESPGAGPPADARSSDHAPHPEEVDEDPGRAGTPREGEGGWQPPEAERPGQVWARLHPPAPSSAFASTTPRIPGSTTSRILVGADGQPDGEDDYSPGPQCYQRFELMGEGSLAGPRLRYREAPGFGVGSSRMAAPRRLDVGDTVGPGDYELPPTAACAAAAAGSPRSFPKTARFSKAGEPPAEDTPGPGMFYRDRESWRRSAAIAAASPGGWGHQARFAPEAPSPGRRQGPAADAQRKLTEMVQSALDKWEGSPGSPKGQGSWTGPAPGDYGAPQGMRGWRPVRLQAQGLWQEEAFLSAVPRFPGDSAEQGPRGKSPGPGSYDPESAGKPSPPAHSFGYQDSGASVRNNASFHESHFLSQYSDIVEDTMTPQLSLAPSLQQSIQQPRNRGSWPAAAARS